MAVQTSEGMRLSQRVDDVGATELTRRAAYGLVLLTLSGVILWSRGFRAIASDHHQYLLPVLQSGSPTFVAGDWFTEQTTAFHYTFQQGLRIAERFDAIIPALTAMHVATLTVLFLAIAMMSRRLGASWWSIPVVLFVLRFGVQRTWGAVDLLGEAALPHYAGLSLALLAIAAAFGQRYGLAAAFLVATAYVHVSVGAWIGLVLATMIVGEFSQGRLDIRSLLRPATVALIALSPLIVVVASDFLGPRTDPQTYRILFEVRSPHHYAFADFGVANHLQIIVVIAIALVAEHLGGYRSRGLRSAVIAITAIGLSGAFFLYVMYWPLPVRLFPYRLAPLLIALAAILAVALLTRRDVARSHRVFGGGAVLVLLVIEPSQLLDPLGSLLGDAPSPGAAVVASMLAAALCAAVLASRTFSLSASTLIALGLLSATAAVTVALTMHQPPTHTLRWLPPAQEEFGEAVSEVVPKGEMLVVPPEAHHVRLATGRAVVVDFKTFPMVGVEMKEWKQRLEDVTGKPISTDGPGGKDLRNVLSNRYHQQPLEAIRDAGEHYGATYLLVDEDSVAGRRALDRPTARGRLLGDYILAPVDGGNQR